MLSAAPKMSEPIYFVVLQGAKGIYATKYHDHLPTHFPDPAIYRLRLDRLDNPERWAGMSLNKLLGILFADEGGG
jgi:hypothetical protein